MNDRIPPWIRRTLSPVSASSKIFRNTYAKGLHTVCKEARCPNRWECESRGTATFLILGDRCTRNCVFCAVRHGNPVSPHSEEPELVAASIANLRLSHAVVTSVTRDDLPDGGASVFAQTIGAIRKKSPETTIEVLIPDFQGCKDALRMVVEARPEVINHNMETVQRLYPVLRSAASYSRSLELLQRVASAGIIAKSGIMVGVGETREEIIELMSHLARVGCSVLTIGQYLQPSKKHIPVIRYFTVEEFLELKELALEEGLKTVVSGPLVRSSYKSAEMLRELAG
ncbi:MAG: lipoyl synthase [Desulfomonile tiedjei]|uniref:Lipoyl synthase n=1 Tax=Desulfomonile tiedjei TaxID=2358 RepID=A0A9D6Z451_9BACT|nr:lipoyl synthase [Desulfomonile tiedjei]